MRVSSITILILVATLSAPVMGSVWLADYHGYDFTWPLPNNYTEDGQFYAAVGPLVSMNEDFFVLDEDNNEYTMHIHSGVLTSTYMVGTYAFYEYMNGDGTLNFYEDPFVGGTPADYGTYPPNPTSPSTFIDGTFMLGGSFESLTIIIETVSGDGNLTGTLNLNDGDYIGNIPPNMREGWTISALGLGHPPYTPEGYTNQIDGEVYLEQQPTPTKQSTWGLIKRIYNR
ncbi:MAG: hypothetical protein KJ970_01310 [Candidatus Eisenbacteria bacterium]|uniref:PEP-CTERM sorting domain-containing protein n=1 Tax=Eiseniibacteriota bacterium TaxID=2212470 RepID=A0A948RRA5_UNCEI|nr:hypothetical protein [Candidatus Eisenbacteria bacterium]MBU1948696.1 hypothetical protein [Candidatus Eisenbacteria bacterium]MBU2689540.1 hypothetical protein [Candidatus Eisenbacteria bacterium]